MNAENRLKHAARIWREVLKRAETKRGLNNDLGGIAKKIEDALTDDTKKITIETLKKYYNQQKKIEGQRKEVNAEINHLRVALEDCIFGKGEYDKAQINFEDILSLDEDEKGKDELPQTKEAAKS